MSFLFLSLECSETYFAPSFIIFGVNICLHFYFMLRGLCPPIPRFHGRLRPSVEAPPPGPRCFGIEIIPTAAFGYHRVSLLDQVNVIMNISTVTTQRFWTENIYFLLGPKYVSEHSEVKKC